MNAHFDVTNIQIETSRLLLRPFVLSDVDDFYEYASNPDVGPNAGWPPHQNKEESLEILKSFINGKENFAIVYKENNKVIGSIGILKNMERSIN